MSTITETIKSHIDFDSGLHLENNIIFFEIVIMKLEQ